jgi:hypothetical protein
MRFILESRIAQVVVAVFLLGALGVRFVARLRHWAPGWAIECIFYLALLAGLFALPLLEAICTKRNASESHREEHSD